MQLRRDWSPAREDEGLERRELGFHRIDPAFELLDPRRFDTGEARRAGRGEVRADLEQVALHREKLRVRLDGEDDAEAGVQLVDRAVGVDARIVLRNTRTAEERR